MARERFDHRSLQGQGKRLPKSYRKYLRRKLAKAENEQEYQRWLVRRRELLDKLRRME